ncbi:MAG: hypothetical protein ABIJ41_00085 [Candidatus Omnitrophota bacterium]
MIFGHLITSLKKSIKKIVKRNPRPAKKKTRKKSKSGRSKPRLKTKKLRVVKKKIKKVKHFKKRQGKKRIIPKKRRFKKKARKRIIGQKSTKQRRQSIKRKPPDQAPRISQKAKSEGLLIGEITHYFSKIEVCVIKMTNGQMALGDRIKIQGSTSDFIQKVTSLQIENSDVRLARKGQLVGMKVNSKCREGNQVFKLS